MTPLSGSTVDVGYPVYGCDFDPQDASRLFVGGGGGATQSGVGNKITLLDVSSNGKIEKNVEVTLSSKEDNVANLATGQRKGKTTLLYAGINSSPDDLKLGNNKHFRVFGAEAPKAKSILGCTRITELSRTQLFTPASTNTYQRLLRLSRPGGTGSCQLGAVATGLADNHQIVLCDLAPGSSTLAPTARNVLNLSREAVDLDVIRVNEDQFQLIYCDEYDIYTAHVPKSGRVGDAPKHIYTIPHDDSSGVRPALRCLRYLTPHFAIGVANIPQAGGGVVLYGFRLPEPSKHDDDKSSARIAVSARLPKKGGLKATGLAVANLGRVLTPAATPVDTQFVLAVAGTDMSIHLYTLNHHTMGNIDMLVNLYPLTTIRHVHAAMITSMCFSHFVPPKSSTGRVQHLKLASTSVANAVAVQCIPLRKFIDRAAPVRRGGPPRQPRYVVAMKSHAPSMTRLLMGFAAVVVVLGVLLQGLLEVQGLASPTVGGHWWIPSSFHRVPTAAMASGPPHAAAGLVAKLLDERKRAGAEARIAVLEVGEEIEVITGPFDESTYGSATRWEDLYPAQKEAWKERLQKAGQWAEESGETFLKGILFGELAKVVRTVVDG